MYDSREIRAPNLLIWSQMRCCCAMPPMNNGGSLEGCINGHCDFKHQLPRVASGVGRCHVAVASGFAVGQWLQGEWTRSLLMRREGGIMRVASATGVGHIGWWHWSAGGIGQAPSAQLSLF